VDLLLVTPRFVDAHEGEAEDFVRDAIASGADVEVPSGEAAERLDRAAEGIAARLRFAIDEPPAAGDALGG
jgi:peptide subunit release factor 1 (eRF1)